LIPVFLLTELLTVTANHFLGVAPLLRGVAAVSVFFMSLALVGLATGLGARYPRFNADNPSQVAGSYGGVAFMIVAVLFMLTLIALIAWPSSMYLFYAASAPRAMPGYVVAIAAACVTAAFALSVGTFWFGMRTGIRALESMG